MQATITKYRKKPVIVEAMQFRQERPDEETAALYDWIKENSLGSFSFLDYEACIRYGMDPLSTLFPEKSSYFPERKDYANQCAVSIDPVKGQIVILTLEGLMRVSDKDYVIRGIKGEFYPCKPEIFEMNHTVALTD